MEQAETNGNGHGPPPIPVAPLHPSIVKASLKIQAAVTAIAKDGKNPHGGYNFSSTDAVYAGLTHKMAECGLMILCLEEKEPEIVRVEKEGKVSQWGKFVFSFVLATEEATWTDPRSRRSLFIQITGPQTFMAAQSYAEKTYLRSYFKLPTGDMDLDSMPQADTEEEQVNLATIKRKRSAQAKRDGTDEVFKSLQKEVDEIDSAVTLGEFLKNRAKELRALPKEWYINLAEDISLKAEKYEVEFHVVEESSLRMS